MVSLLLLVLGSIILTLLLFITWKVVFPIGRWILRGIGKLLYIVVCVMLWYIGKWIILGISKLLCLPFRICKGNDIEEGGVSKPTCLKNEVGGDGTKVGESGNKLGGGVSISVDKMEIGGGGGNRVGGIPKPTDIPSKGKEVGGKLSKKKKVGDRNGEGVFILREATELPFIDISILREATENFSNENELGRGGFGVVYKGRLNDGMEVAVKKLKSTGRLPKDFEREVQSLARIRHKNVVKLHCYCIDGEEYYLVYEFMPNKSLADKLFNKTTSDQLDMEKRHNIIHGIAKGIRYLHEESEVIIIHRDLKPANILLDGKKNPKIADFGNAKIFNDEQIEAFASEPIATRGYMPREYLLGGEYSRGTDVFSFGVLLLEIISGERNCSFHNLLAKAWNLWSTGNHIDFVDPFLLNSCSMKAAKKEIEKKLLRWIHVGLLCVQGDPTPRPTMTKILHMLEGDSAIDRQPTKPPIEYATKYAMHTIEITSCSDSESE